MMLIKIVEVFNVLKDTDVKRILSLRNRLRCMSPYDLYLLGAEENYGND